MISSNPDRSATRALHVSEKETKAQMTHLVSTDGGLLTPHPALFLAHRRYLRKTQSGIGGSRGWEAWKPYRPCRGEGQPQVCLTFLVLSAVLLKRDLKGQEERTRRLRPPDPGGPEPDLSAPFPLLPPWSPSVGRVSGWAVCPCPAEQRRVRGPGDRKG